MQPARRSSSRPLRSLHLRHSSGSTTRLRTHRPRGCSTPLRASSSWTMTRQTGVLEPEAATAMPTVSADGKTYTFTVRPGQVFSGGPAEPVSADSFKRAIERATSPTMAASISATPPARQFVAGIDGSAAFYRRHGRRSPASRRVATCSRSSSRTSTRRSRSASRCRTSVQRARMPQPATHGSAPLGWPVLRLVAFRLGERKHG